LLLVATSFGGAHRSRVTGQQRDSWEELRAAMRSQRSPRRRTALGYSRRPAPGREKVPVFKLEAEDGKWLDNARFSDRGPLHYELPARLSCSV